MIQSGTRRRCAALKAIIASVPGTTQAVAAQVTLDKILAANPGLDLPELPNLEPATSWRAAVHILVLALTKAGASFSPGELVRTIRLNRQDLHCSCAGVTRFVANMLITYGSSPAVRVVRVTSGATRSPAGLKVIVYAPTRDAGLAHDFEVEIPPPRQRMLAQA